MSYGFHGEYSRVSCQDELEGTIAKIEAAFQEFQTIFVTIFDGRKRSDLQNSLQHAMYREIGKQLYGGDSELAKRECKLTIGVPLLRESSEEFKSVYDKNLKRLDYEAKLQVVGMIKVSSILSVADAHKFIDSIYNNYAMKGVGWSDFIRKGRDALLS